MELWNFEVKVNSSQNTNLMVVTVTDRDYVGRHFTFVSERFNHSKQNEDVWMQKAVKDAVFAFLQIPKTEAK